MLKTVKKKTTTNVATALLSDSKTDLFDISCIAIVSRFNDEFRDKHGYWPILGRDCRRMRIGDFRSGQNTGPSPHDVPNPSQSDPFPDDSTDVTRGADQPPERGFVHGHA
jgi:hypothetical protein